MTVQFPTVQPDTPVLDRVHTELACLRTLSHQDLQTLADELRQFMLYSVSKTGGHFGAGLGVVELSIALHHVLNTPEDRIVWDVGHQTYPHKILTGRMDRLATIRQAGGLSGFPKRTESPFDTFGVGHSSTSISAAMGMAVAAGRRGWIARWWRSLVMARSPGAWPSRPSPMPATSAQYAGDSE